VRPDIPEDQLARISPILRALEESFRPLADGLTFDEEPAVIFELAPETAA
jgi:hypothetical protein